MEGSAAGCGSNARREPAAASIFGSPGSGQGLVAQHSDELTLVVADRDSDASAVDSELELEHRGVEPAPLPGELGDEVGVGGERGLPALDVFPRGTQRRAWRLGRRLGDGAGTGSAFGVGMPVRAVLGEPVGDHQVDCRPVGIAACRGGVERTAFGAAGVAVPGAVLEVD